VAGVVCVSGPPVEDSELKAPVDVAFVQYVIEQNGQANLRASLAPFVATPQGFKFLPKR
jgi:hypothetical protein